MTRVWYPSLPQRHTVCLRSPQPPHTFSRVSVFFSLTALPFFSFSLTKSTNQPFAQHARAGFCGALSNVEHRENSRERARPFHSPSPVPAVVAAESRTTCPSGVHQLNSFFVFDSVSLYVDYTTSVLSACRDSCAACGLHSRRLDHGCPRCDDDVSSNGPSVEGEKGVGVPQHLRCALASVQEKTFHVKWNHQPAVCASSTNKFSMWDVAEVDRQPVTAAGPAAAYRVMV